MTGGQTLDGPAIAVVVGATGALGGAAVDKLLERRVPASPSRATSPA